MKQNNLNGFRQVFSFTLKQQMNSKGYKLIMILLAVLLFLLPAVIMPLVEKFGGKDEMTSTKLANVYVVDLTEEATFDWNIMNMAGDAVFSNIAYTDCGDDITAAQNLLEADTYGVILALEKEESGYLANVLLPDETELSGDDTNAFEEFINENFQMVLLTKSGLSPEQLTEIYTPTYGSVEKGIENPEENAEEDPFAGIRQILSFLLPYLNIMILYFLVLYYGQNVANIVLMEKTSKLMDTFLVAIKPAAMIFGKVFAIALASIIQVAIWLVALIAGFFTGTQLVRMINPDTDMMLISFFESIGEFSGVFSIPGAIIAVLIICAGFLLYCAVASIGGSLAGKPEDLGSTNILFTLILIVSFFCTFTTGAMTGNMPSGLSWLDLVPFIAIMVTPSRVLLGNITIVEGLLSLAITLALACVFVWVAGKIYKAMSLYKGNLPKPNQIVKMVTGGLKKDKKKA